MEKKEMTMKRMIMMKPTNQYEFIEYIFEFHLYHIYHKTSTCKFIFLWPPW